MPEGVLPAVGLGTNSRPAQNLLFPDGDADALLVLDANTYPDVPKNLLFFLQIEGL